MARVGWRLYIGVFGTGYSWGGFLGVSPDYEEIRQRAEQAANVPVNWQGWHDEHITSRLGAFTRYQIGFLDFRDEVRAALNPSEVIILEYHMHFDDSLLLERVGVEPTRQIEEWKTGMEPEIGGDRRKRP